MLLSLLFAFHNDLRLLGLLQAHSDVNRIKTCLWILISNRKRQTVGFPACQACQDLPGNRLFMYISKKIKCIYGFGVALEIAVSLMGV